MPKRLSILILLVCINFQGLCNQKIDFLLTLYKEQTRQIHLKTILKVAQELSYENNDDTIIHYARISHREAAQLNDSIAILNSNLYWASGLYSKHEFRASMKKIDELIDLANKLHRPKEKLQALYLKGRNSQGLKKYNEAISHFKEAYLFSIQLFKKNQETHTQKYSKGILRQLAYTYWYAGKINEGIGYFSDLIEENINASKALKRTYYSNISFLYNRGMNTDKAEHHLLKALEISRNSGNSNDIYQDHAYLGALYSAKGNFTKAVIHYEQAMAIAKKQKSNSRVSYILQNLGLCYDAIGNLQKSVDMIFDGIKLFIENGDKKATAKGYQQLGRLMIKWHNFKDADHYLQQALLLHKETKFKIEENIDYLNLTNSKYHQQNKDSALFYLDKLHKQSTIFNITNSECNYYINKACIQVELENKTEGALSDINKAIHLANKTNSTTLKTYCQKILGTYYLAVDSLSQAKVQLLKAWKNHKSLNMLVDQVSTAKQLAQAYKKIQQTDSAYFYLQKADSVNSKLHLRENVLTLYKKGNEFSVLMTKKEKDVLAKENKRLFNRIILIRAFYIFLSISLISLLLVYMKKRTQRLKSEIYAKDSVQKELEIQSKIYRTTITKNNLLIETKEEIIAELNEKLTNNKFNIKSAEKFNEIENLLNSKLITEEDWDQYQQLFTKKNPYFITELKKKFSTLSRNEIKLFILIKLSLTTREMASILMISPSSVNTARYRLRKKIHLDTEQKLEDIIAEIIQMEYSI